MGRRSPPAIGVLLAVGALASACSSTATAPTEDAQPETAAVPSTTSTSVAPAEDLRVVTLNVLHGLPLPDSCGTETDFCQAPDRIDLLWTAIEDDAGCPDVIALQEIGPRQKELVPDRLGDLCAGDHDLLFTDTGNPDQEMILTTLPVVEDSYVEIAGPPWTAHWARLDSDIGVVDVYASHFASSAFNPDCTRGDEATSCPPECPTGIEMGSCNAIEAVAFLDGLADGADVQLLVGDLNKEVDDPRIELILDAGFVDTWLLAGNPECGPVEPTACTSGVSGDSPLDGLDQADQELDSRIDFILARPRAGCELVVDGPGDDDDDGTATGLFAAGPLDPPVNGLAWFSDHQGVQADLGLDCG